MKTKTGLKQVAILSSGLDARKDRGYENSSRILFTNLNGDRSPNYRADLFKGSGKKKHNEFVIRSFANQNWVKNIGYRLFKDSFMIEYIIFTIFYIFYGWFTRKKYDAIYTQEPRVAKTLYQWQKFLWGNPKIVFGMGVNMTPEHYVNICDKVQIVNVEHYMQAIEMYPDSSKFHLIPNVGSDSKTYNGILDKSELREKYNIKTKFVLLSVGAINSTIKRMDYVVEEAANLNENWTLIIAGNPQNKEIIELAKEHLDDRFKQLIISPQEIAEIYKIADVFVLASIVEGFGNVSIETMQNGVPPILHDRELNKWLLKDDDLLIDMLEDNALSNFILSKDIDWFKNKGKKCQNIYNKNYTWNVLKSDFLNLLFK